MAKRAKNWWRWPTKTRCSHGLLVVLVSGTYVRNHFDSDFSQGGNGFRYHFVPKKEIWIDLAIPKAEWPYIATHECQEVEKMRAGASYDRAHALAKRAEDRRRHRELPGE